MEPIVLKITYNGSLRRLSLPAGEERTFSYSRLQSRARELTGLPASANVSFTYIDQDGDAAALESDADVADALVVQRLNPLRITMARVDYEGNPPEAELVVKHIAAVSSVISEKQHEEKKSKVGADSNLSASQSSSVDIDRTPSGIHSGDSGNVIHFGVQCNECDVYPIEGDRFMSSKKADYDLCPACYKKQKSSKTEHFHGHKCDSCRKFPMKGSRFMSLSEKNHDLCLTCFNALSKFEQDSFVEINRGFIRMSEPVSLDIEALTSVLSIEDGSKSREVTHTGISCNLCEMDSIQGRRFKSYKIEDYDLCLPCFERGSEDTGDYAHRGFGCDICNEAPIREPRYASCLKSSYDLCRKCFASMDEAEQSKYVEVNRGVYGLVHPALAKENGIADTVSGSAQGVQSTANRDHHFEKWAKGMQIANSTLKIANSTLKIVSTFTQ